MTVQDADYNHHEAAYNARRDAADDDERCTQCGQNEYRTAHLDRPAECDNCGFRYCRDCRYDGCPMCIALESVR